MKVVFMGTPDFAVPILEAIHNSNHELVAVVTAPDKPAGRGLKMMQSAVKQCADAHEIPTLQPENLKNPDFINELKSFGADLFVVVAFRMLPEVVWNMPPKGTMNLHASLLPNYRGAAPINWAVINGEQETGLTTFLLKHEIDTGDVLKQLKMPIGPNETAGELHDRMMLAGADLVVESMDDLEAGNVKPVPQLHTENHIHAPKIFKPDCRVNWNKTANEVHNLIRGMSPYPTAWTTWNGKAIKLFRSLELNIAHEGEIGATQTDNKTYLNIKCADSWLGIVELQLEGKKRMTITDFLRGNKLENQLFI
ncbi:MAG: methionyl-tRNA formyltransferase [Bacteroidetes bacterium]|nr:methionyl-tRNA formyltransferase [Bacteroidota bacterium]